MPRYSFGIELTACHNTVSAGGRGVVQPALVECSRVAAQRQ